MSAAASASAAAAAAAATPPISSDVLLVDNYDSFTYNVLQYLAALGARVTVRRNDACSAQQLAAMHFDHVVISPGPGRPADAGVTKQLIAEIAGKVPILGICLGHQAIVEVFGGDIVIADEIVHGKTSVVRHDGKGVFEGLPRELHMTRYHSLVALPSSIPSCLEVTSRTAAGDVMGVRHRRFNVEGVQFHPESITSENGQQLFANFLRCRDAMRTDAGTA